MKASNFAYLVLIVVGLSGGQILFKLAGRAVAASESFARGILSPYLFASLFLYGIITLLWIWQLSLVDLSRAYPVISLTFVVVPLLGALLLGETVGIRYWFGVGCIIVGILVMQVEI